MVKAHIAGAVLFGLIAWVVLLWAGCAAAAARNGGGVGAVLFPVAEMRAELRQILQSITLPGQIGDWSNNFNKYKGHMLVQMAAVTVGMMLYVLLMFTCHALLGEYIIYWFNLWNWAELLLRQLSPALDALEDQLIREGRSDLIALYVHSYLAVTVLPIIGLFWQISNANQSMVAQRAHVDKLSVITMLKQASAVLVIGGTFVMLGYITELLSYAFNEFNGRHFTPLGSILVLAFIKGITHNLFLFATGVMIVAVLQSLAMRMRRVR